MNKECECLETVLEEPMENTEMESNEMMEPLDQMDTEQREVLVAEVKKRPTEDFWLPFGKRRGTEAAWEPVGKRGMKIKSRWGKRSRGTAGLWEPMGKRSYGRILKRNYKLFKLYFDRQSQKPILQDKRDQHWSRIAKRGSLDDWQDDWDRTAFQEEDQEQPRDDRFYFRV